MKNKIGFVAVGQAGGNVGFLLEKAGYSVLYLNTSQEDLETLKEAKYKHHIAGGEGCNKDRMKAKQLIMDDFEVINRKISDSLSCEMIYVIFSSGGGTGSGAGPMLSDLLVNAYLDTEVSIGVITILPALSESIKANLNCYECFSELAEIEGLGSIIALDNNRMEKMALNQKFAKTFTSFLEIPQKHKSERGNIDKAEILETLRASGMLQITDIPVQQAKNTSVISESFRRGIYADLEDDGIVKYITISVSGSLDMEQLQKDIGIPIDIFQTYNQKSTICCLSGLSFPDKRLNLVYDKIHENKDRISQVLSDKQPQSMKSISFLSGVQTTSSKSIKSVESKGKTSSRDVMAKYLKK